jgi:hypothetical protein
MNEINQHRPPYVDGYDNVCVCFSTDDELFEIPFVKCFRHSNFSRYAMSGNHLMAIYDDGFEWWVIGTIKDPPSVHLPKWDGGKYRALLDGEPVILSRDVASSCGDVLTLKDGRTAKNLRKFG